MPNYSQLIVFVLENQFYALPSSTVERVIPAVEITRLPKAPGMVQGIINIQGQVVPVFDIRKRFNLPARPLMHTNHFIIARSNNRLVAISTDRVNGLIEYVTKKLVEADSISPDLDYVTGVIKLDDGMVLIHDLDSFLSVDEKQILDQAMNEIIGNSETRDATR